jgi:hypothetical protein
MDKFASIGNLCKELVFDIIAPYKYTKVEELLSDDEISSTEKSVKCTALAVGNLFTNAMMLSIDVIKRVSASVHNGYLVYIQTDDIHIDEDQQLNDSEDDSEDEPIDLPKTEMPSELDKASEINRECDKDTCDDCTDCDKNTSGSSEDCKCEKETCDDCDNCDDCSKNATQEK